MRKVKRALAAACLLFAVLCPLAHAQSDARGEGRKDAQKDIQSGVVKYLLYGEPQPYDRFFAEILQKDYKILLVDLGGCTVSGAARGKADGYNEVMRSHLNAAFKGDPIKEAEDKARKQWEQARAKGS